MVNISKIAYYTRENDKSKTLSLRKLQLKELYKNDFETIFYTVRDAEDTCGLLEKFGMICCEQFEFVFEDVARIIFEVIDFYGNINYLSFIKKKEYHLGHPEDKATKKFYSLESIKK